jgi:hypothetical protein
MDRFLQLRNLIKFLIKSSGDLTGTKMSLV